MVCDECAMSDAADLHAVGRTLGGDPDAFSEIVERYTPVVYSLAARMLGSSEEAEEATQEVFLKAYRSLGRFRLSRRCSKKAATAVKTSPRW